MNNEVGKRIRGKNPLPKVRGNKMPTIDTFMRSVISVSAKSLDLAKMQTFVVDALAPLTAMLEQGCQKQYSQYGYGRTTFSLGLPRLATKTSVSNWPRPTCSSLRLV